MPGNMTHKILRCAVAAIIISITIPLYCFARNERPKAFNLTGKIVSPLYTARINVLYSDGKNPPVIYNFIITKRTQIKGVLKVGAEVNVTFKRRRRPNRMSKREALFIEVLKRY